MLEVEMKFPDADFAAIERRLTEWKAEPAGEREEIDHYFNAPDRDFAQTDEALRIRHVGEQAHVTYKGPKRDAQTKTRTEIELSLGPGSKTADEFARLLQHLGYRPVAHVRKRRRYFHAERDGFHLEICLDEVEGLGRFIELEIQALEEKLEAARSVVLRVASELGLEKSERRSYLELLLGSQAARA